MPPADLDVGVERRQARRGAAAHRAGLPPARPQRPGDGSACFVHHNTVRYRLGVARDLLRGRTASADPLDDVAVALLADAVLNPSAD